MKKLLQKMIGDKAGASAAEYALILAVIGIGVVVAFQTLQGSITDAVTDAATEMDARPA